MFLFKKCIYVFLLINIKEKMKNNHNREQDFNLINMRKYKYSLYLPLNKKENVFLFIISCYECFIKIISF